MQHCALSPNHTTDIGTANALNRIPMRTKNRTNRKSSSSSWDDVFFLKSKNYPDKAIRNMIFDQIDYQNERIQRHLESRDDQDSDADSRSITESLFRGMSLVDKSGNPRIARTSSANRVESFRRQRSKEKKFPTMRTRKPAHTASLGLEDLDNVLSKKGVAAFNVPNDNDPIMLVKRRSNKKPSVAEILVDKVKNKFELNRF